MRKDERPLLGRAGLWVVRAAVAAAALLLVLAAASAGWVLLYRWVDPPATALMLAVDHANGDAPIAHTWCPLDAISPHLALAVLAAEDARFARHNGFDTEEIRRALADHLEGEPLRGASTISQQTAKNVFLWPSRSWTRKALEVYFTVLEERLWGKRRILEVYLNVAEWGDGVFGAEAAARAYFDKPAASLTAEEAALLAAVLPNPRRYSAAAPSDSVRQRQQRILTGMKWLGGPSYLDTLPG